MAANQFVKTEFDKIFKNESFEFPKNALMASAWLAANYKGINIKAFDVQSTSSLCDYNLLITATNITQARTIVDELRNNLRFNELEIISIEGFDDADWILVDAGDIIIHIFQEYSREIFDLDSLWKEFPIVEIPQEYYFSNPEMEKATEENADKHSSNTTENYF